MLKTRIGFSTTNHLLSKIIKKITNSKCSHVWFLYYDENFKCDMVMEAHFTYQLIPFEMFKKNNKIIEIIAPKHSIESSIISSAKWLGSMYDVTGLLGMTWVKIGRWLRHCWKNPFRSTRNVYCSEVVARGLIEEKYPELPFKDPETVDPNEILEWFVNGEINK